MTLKYTPFTKTLRTEYTAGPETYNIHLLIKKMNEERNEAAGWIEEIGNKYDHAQEKLYLLDSYTDALVNEIEWGASIERLQELAKIYKHNKKEGLYD